MDFTKFDALPAEGVGYRIRLGEYSHAGIKDMPTLADTAAIVSGRLREDSLDPARIARYAGVGENVILLMGEGRPVPIAQAMRVFETLGVKPVRVPPEYMMD